MEKPQELSTEAKVSDEPKSPEVAQEQDAASISAAMRSVVEDLKDERAKACLENLLKSFDVVMDFTKNSFQSDEGAKQKLSHIVDSVCVKFQDTFTEMMKDKLLEETKALESTAQAKERAKILHELVQTEEEYYKDLEVLNVFWRQEMRKSGVLTQQQVDTIFDMIPQLYFLAKDLAESFAKVEKLPLAEQNLGQVLLKKLPFLKMYADQCGKMAHITECVHELESKPDFVQVCKTIMADPCTKNVDLMGFLIKPTQRLAVYPLLIKSILKNTDMDHPDRASLEKSYESFNEILRTVNDTAKMRTSLAFFRSVQNSFSWSSQAIDFIKSDCVLVFSDNVSWEVISTHSGSVKTSGNYAIISNKVCIFAEKSKNDFGGDKFREHKTFITSALRPTTYAKAQKHDLAFEILIFKKNFFNVPLDGDAQVLSNVLVPRVSSKRRISIAGPPVFREQDGSKSGGSESKKDYILVLHCSSFLDKNSWEMQIKSAQELATTTCGNRDVALVKYVEGKYSVRQVGKQKSNPQLSPRLHSTESPSPPPQSSSPGSTGASDSSAASPDIDGSSKPKHSEPMSVFWRSFSLRKLKQSSADGETTLRSSALPPETSQHNKEKSEALYLTSPASSADTTDESTIKFPTATSSTGSTVRTRHSRSISMCSHKLKVIPDTEVSTHEDAPSLDKPDDKVSEYTSVSSPPSPLPQDLESSEIEQRPAEV